MEKFSVSRLVGAPPGYVGYDEGGQLTEKVRRRPYAVVLLDEIEKAHPEVFNILLQILDDGRLTDGQGRTVNFRNTVIIMTSNIGQEIIQKQAQIGFKANKEDNSYREMKEKLLGEVRNTFRPEFINRLDEIIVFNPLNKENMQQILEIEIAPLVQRLKVKGITLSISKNAKEYLLEKGFDINFGARPLKRTIQKYVQDPLALKLLKGEIKEGGKVAVELGKDNNIEFR